MTYSRRSSVSLDNTVHAIHNSYFRIHNWQVLYVLSSGTLDLLSYFFSKLEIPASCAKFKVQACYAEVYLRVAEYREAG